jgi:hypothetical protein
VEFSDVCQVLAEAWIPDPADWIPFYTGHIAPFLRAHAEMATAGQLDRIGNCLIAFARFGGPARQPRVRPLAARSRPRP